MRIWIIILTAIILTLGGCSKGETAFRLHQEPYHSANNKMELSNNNPYWSLGDIIVINGQDYTVTGARNNASIGNIEPSSQYIAMFPKSCYVSDNGVNSISFKYPTEQTLRYNAQGEQLLEAPMCAYAERNARALEFKNLGSILRLNVTNNGDKDLYI